VGIRNFIGTFTNLNLHGNTNAFQFLVYTSRIGRIITDRSDEDMNSDMTPYGMLLDVLISPKK
jgi:hypothetical protein